MADEPGWTLETLRLHFQAILELRDRRYQERFDAQNGALNAALASAEKAVGKAEDAAEKRFASVNEFRGQLADQASTLMPRSEAEQRIATNGDKIDALEKRINEVVGRMDLWDGRYGGHSDSTKMIVTVLGLVLTAITVLVGIFVALHR